MSEFEKRLLERIEKLERENQKINKTKIEKVPSYKYSKIKDSDLMNLFDIEKILNQSKFNQWFNNKILLNKDINLFLEDLISKNKELITSYNEVDLKINFIGPLLNEVNFKSLKDKFRDFYETQLTYDAGDFILKGITDFVVAKGLAYSKKPYFFISNPRPQLLSELISAVELNDWNTIRGAYIVGENWNFVILNKLEKHKYEYFVSRTFNSTNIEDLKDIFKNLLFVKQEIIEMIKRGD